MRWSRIRQEQSLGILKQADRRAAAAAWGGNLALQRPRGRPGAGFRYGPTRTAVLTGSASSPTPWT